MTSTTHPNPVTGTAPERTGPTAHRTPAPPLTRLTLVELRKLADTRAGWWLLAVIGLLAAAAVTILLLVGAPAEQTFAEFFNFGLLPAAVLLPVLGILSMTGEWSQRTALTTFALVPSRGRVVVAKLTAAVLIAVAATLVTLGIAAVGNLLAVAGDGAGSWNLQPDVLARTALVQVLYVLMGSGFGALLLNSPLAIVLYFALPTAWSFLGELVRWLRRAAEWIDLNVTSTALMEPDITGGQWARLGASVAVWVVLPLVAGTVRLLRREVS